MKKIIIHQILLFILIIVILTGCGRHKIKPNLPAEERMKTAEKMFNDGDYLDARTQFRIVILNSPGGSLSDKAQFYYAECHFKLKEYILAIAEYEKLIRMYSNSDYVDDAQYKIGLSYYKLSPKPALDQTNTEKALEEFQKFLEDYPNSPLVPKANEFMHKCRGKLAQKNFRNGESYRKRALYRSALVYYDYVLDNYYDTKYAEKSLWEKAECYRRIGDIEQAEKFYKLFLEKYPKSSKADKIKDLLSSIKTNDDTNN
jgi:outer membrane protein assembly factor BamD